jgi:hypothetical protein
MLGVGKPLETSPLAVNHKAARSTCKPYSNCYPLIVDLNRVFCLLCPQFCVYVFESTIASWDYIICAYCTFLWLENWPGNRAIALQSCRQRSPLEPP